MRKYSQEKYYKAKVLNIRHRAYVNISSVDTEFNIEWLQSIHKYNRLALVSIELSIYAAYINIYNLNC